MDGLIQIDSGKCMHCTNKAETRLRHLGPLCRRCFCAVVEKRVRKYARTNQIFKKNDRILVIDALLEYLVKSILEGLPVNIFYNKIGGHEIGGKKAKEYKEYIMKKRINKIVIPWTADDEAQLVLEKFFHGKKDAADGKIVKLLSHILDEEAVLFAKFKGLKFKPNKKDKDIIEFIHKLEEKNPGAVFGLMKSSEQLKAII